jgi:hypothetical protein
MPRVSLSRFVFAIVIGLSLIGGGVLPSLAQGDEPVVDETVVPLDQEAPGTGWLQISAVSCTSGGDPGAVSILLAAEYAPAGECIDGTQALLVDGVDYGPVAPYLELQLDAGFHNLYDPVSGATRDVEIVPDGATQVVVVAFTAAEPTAEPTVEPAAETVTSGLTIVAHSCKPEIQSADQLWSIGNVTARLDACPAMTLPGYPSPGGTANGGEQYFDFTLAPATDDAQTLTGNGAFISDAFCESAVGALDNDPTNDRCVSNSGFSFQLPEGPITLTQTAVPDLMRYVAAEAGSDADAGVITGSDPSSGYLGLDTSLRGSEQPVIHLFYLNPPRLNVIMHLCGGEISSSDDLNALGSLAAQILTCPATARAVEGGSADFGITVSDGNWGARGFDSAVFDPTVTCESDIGDWNGDGGDNACVDAPTYRFDQTAQGYVAVTQDYLPAGYAFGGANNSDGGAITGVDPSTGSVSLDTSFDGDVTVHLFAIVETVEPTSTSTPTAMPTKTRTPVPPSATATRTPTPTSPAASQTPTRTATVAGATSTSTSIAPTATEPTGSTDENGTLTVVALYCLTSSGTSVVALAPGASASASDLGGSSCFAGDTSIQITYADGGSLPAFKLGRDGVESIQNIPATSGTLHTLSEQLTGQSATFAIDPGTVTRVIVKFGAGTSMVDEGVSSSAGGPGGTGGTGSTDGLVTDELIGDEGALFGSSFSGISYTSLVVEDVDAQAVSSVTDAKSLPGVGVWPGASAQQILAMLAALSVLLAALALAARRDGAR